MNEITLIHETLHQHFGWHGARLRFLTLFVCHVEIRVHWSFENRDVAKSGEVCGVGIEAEGTGNQDIKSCIARFTSRAHEIRTRNRAKL